MSIIAEIDELKRLKVCCNCVGEPFLSDEISHQGKIGKCSYCGNREKQYSLEKLSNRIETAFEIHYVRTSDQPTSFQYAMLADKESDYDWEREGEPVVDAIINAAEISEEVATHVQRVLEDKFCDYDPSGPGDETEFSYDSYYEERATDGWKWQEEWRAFERLLKTEARFFSQSASELLASIFDGIDTMRTRDGRPLVVNAGPDTALESLFRARTFQSDDKLESALARPDIHLGSPPSVHASAGRMNARGISVFYGANDPLVALAEVRPPVGSRVAIARFEIIRAIKLLDLTALNAVITSGSIFDPKFISRLERAMFLRNLSQRITVPVMPADEDFEYLATQAIADFLATESARPLDGIIFPSVQVAGGALNIVLFHKSACVREIELPAGTEIKASLGQMYEDGWEDDFSVIEEVPPKTEELEMQQPPQFPLGFYDSPADWRPPTLQISLDSVDVHIVKGVQFKTDEHKVRRHRWEKKYYGF